MHAVDIPELNARFAIPGQVSFRTVNGMTVVEIANATATASLAMQGAHLLHWTPRGMSPVIWLSPQARFAPGTPIRGGVPICWPWFGPPAGGSGLPSHGFARISPWELLEVRPSPEVTHLAFRLAPSAGAQAQWPPTAVPELHMTIGARLEMELVTSNTGSKAITIGQALHAYFVVGDVRQVRIEGLDGCPYIDKVDGGRRGIQDGTLIIGRETDRIYLDATVDCIIDDPVLTRRIRIGKHGSRSTVVWNPWADKAASMGDLGENNYLRMVCVEAANVADDLVTVAPDSSCRLGVVCSVEA
jgi:D-hexose-6-phosphate mutarotase